MDQTMNDKTSDEKTDDVSVDEPTAEGTEAAKDQPAADVQDHIEEGEYAADYIENLLDILDMDGDIEMYVENGRAGISVVGDALSTRRLKVLVGEDGSVLNALQDLTRLAVAAQTGERSRCMLDIAGHRAGHKKAIASVAEKAIERVKSSGLSVDLEPMNPFERKVVHDAVLAAGLRSDSNGEEPQRYVTIHPAS